MARSRTQRADSEILKELKDRENQNTRSTKREWKEEIEFFERCLSTLGRFIDEAVSGDKYHATPRPFVALFVPRLFVSLKSMMNLMMQGYYYDVFILLRTWLESLGLCINLCFNKDNAEKWTDGKEIDIPRYRLVDEIIQLIQPGSAAELRPFYGIYSRFVHGHPAALLTYFEKRGTPFKIEGKSFQVRYTIAPIYDSQQVDDLGVFVCPALLLACLLELFKENVSDTLKDEVLTILGQLKPKAGEKRSSDIAQLTNNPDHRRNKKSSES